MGSAMAQKLLSLALYLASVGVGVLAMWIASKYNVRQPTLWAVFVATAAVLIASLSLVGVRLFPGDQLSS